MLYRIRETTWKLLVKEGTARRNAHNLSQRTNTRPLSQSVRSQTQSPQRSGGQEQPGLEVSDTASLTFRTPACRGDQGP